MLPHASEPLHVLIVLPGLTITYVCTWSASEPIKTQPAHPLGHLVGLPCSTQTHHLLCTPLPRAHDENYELLGHWAALPAPGDAGRSRF